MKGLILSMKTVIQGNVRVQIYSDHLIRFEEKGAKGFEDRQSFVVVDRHWAGGEVDQKTQPEGVTLMTRFVKIFLPANCKSLSAVGITELQAKKNIAIKKIPKNSNLPAPNDTITHWLMADSPRIIPPVWGAAAPPDANTDTLHSGWDIENDAADVYLFLPGEGGYSQLAADFLKLTGKIPLPPLYIFGLIDSRYYPYTEDEALQVIDEYRKKEIPLDVFVVDTDWRVGASHGYAVNAEYFPDMQRFIDRAHQRHVRVMFNDHPEPVAEHALSSDELSYREKGLKSLLDFGADVWWFDRNWHTHLKEPAPGLRKEVWGMRMYQDMTQRHKPGVRPLIMSNVEGIDNGKRHYPTSPAAHRFPIWWTGDTRSAWKDLERGVINAVNSGFQSMLPYLSEDLGGHFGMPSEELYLRFLQYGVFSSIVRLHCTAGKIRYPWVYGEAVEQIARNFIQLRYHMLPLIYAAARQAYDSGMPLLRRCDFFWKDYPEAADPTQYMFGDHLLVAPVIKKGGKRMLWLPPGEWIDAWRGERHCGAKMLEVEVALHEIPLFIRAGAIIPTLPKLQFVDQAIWQKLIIEVYLAEDDFGTAATIYEDDGKTNAYLDQKFCQTRLACEQRGQKITFNIAPMQGDVAGRLTKRSWVFRFNQSQKYQSCRASINGKAATVHAYKVPCVETVQEIIPIWYVNQEWKPFGGEICFVPPKAGKTIQVILDDIDTDTAQCIELEFKR